MTGQRRCKRVVKWNAISQERNCPAQHLLGSSFVVSFGKYRRQWNIAPAVFSRLSPRARAISKACAADERLCEFAMLSYTEYPLLLNVTVFGSRQSNPEFCGALKWT